ncbi:MAG: signal peptidase II [Deltaproteobacteria bacterium]|nr:signal peptidase II [Deltaproteobacteria bacterium]
MGSFRYGWSGDCITLKGWVLQRIITLIQECKRRVVVIKKIALKYWLLMVIVLTLLVSDQATKAMVINSLSENETIPVLEGYLNLTHVRNQGAAFGILSDGGARIQRYFFIPITIVVSLAILIIISHSRKDEIFKVISLSMVLSGALGNLMDRVRWGGVVDFIDIHYGTLHWPAFNVADASISIGVILLIVHLIVDHN